MTQATSPERVAQIGHAVIVLLRRGKLDLGQVVAETLITEKQALATRDYLQQQGLISLQPDKGHEDVTAPFQQVYGLTKKGVKESYLATL